MSTKKTKEFDFSRFPERRISLMFLYFGWEFEGLVPQPHTQNTVEEVVLNALAKTKLIKSKESCGLNRCGRTDKGVSGFRQVCSLLVRSTDVNGEGVCWLEGSEQEKRIKGTKELDYVKILNGVLPSSIRILAWSPVDSEFNARFNCNKRVYTYVFPKSTYNIERMRSASQYLVGSHDFRNFCRIDNNKARLETTYVRNIFDVSIDEMNQEEVTPYKMYMLKVEGSGFLWHMIRCIVGVLFEVGMGKEEPEVITHLLDIENCPARPQYNMAKETPLCLFDCTYNVPLNWKFDAEVLKRVIISLEKSWLELKIKADQVKSMLNTVQSWEEEIDSVNDHKGMNEFMTDAPTTVKHIPMMKRPKCESLDSRIEKVAMKKAKKDNGE